MGVYDVLIANKINKKVAAMEFSGAQLQRSLFRTYHGCFCIMHPNIKKLICKELGIKFEVKTIVKFTQEKKC